jgi:hypothetical protein
MKLGRWETLLINNPVRERLMLDVEAPLLGRLAALLTGFYFLRVAVGSRAAGCRAR